MMPLSLVWKDPWVLVLTPLVVFAAGWMVFRHRPPALNYPTLAWLHRVPSGRRARWVRLPDVCWLLALTMWMMAAAGPRSVLEQVETTTEGIDIVLAIDISNSMAAMDFVIDGERKNRLEAVKKVVEEFIRRRPHDRIGLVVFAGEAFTVSPLTTDQAWLIANLKRIQLGMIQDGTAIGDGLSTALLRLKDSSAKSKIVILLTDGVNNTGEVPPLEAAKAAQTLGIKVYTIGAGTKGLAPFPFVDLWGRTVIQRVKVDIDEETLEKIAELTGGQYFRATDTDSLEKVYQEIDALEKTEIQETGYYEYKELFPWLVIPGIILILMAVLLKVGGLVPLPG